MSISRGFVQAVLVGSVAVVTAASFAGAQTAAVDPQSLVGEWIGRWTNRTEVNTNGAYYLTIEKVEGSKVTGKGEVHDRRTNTFKFLGTLNGDRLRFGAETVVELILDGDRLEGTSTGIVNRSIKLARKK